MERPLFNDGHVLALLVRLQGGVRAGKPAPDDEDLGVVELEGRRCERVGCVRRAAALRCAASRRAACRGAERSRQHDRAEGDGASAQECAPRYAGSFRACSASLVHDAPSPPVSVSGAPRRAGGSILRGISARRKGRPGAFIPVRATISAVVPETSTRGRSYRGDRGGASPATKIPYLDPPFIAKCAMLRLGHPHAHFDALLKGTA